MQNITNPSPLSPARRIPLTSSCLRDQGEQNPSEVLTGAIILPVPEVLAEAEILPMPGVSTEAEALPAVALPGVRVPEVLTEARSSSTTSWEETPGGPGGNRGARHSDEQLRSQLCGTSLPAQQLHRRVVFSPVIRLQE